MYERAQAEQSATSEPQSSNGTADGAGAAEEEVVDAEVVDEQK
jgi:hypothetical protein